MKTALDILNETIAAYTSETRAIVGRHNDCDYITNEGRMCAVGRCMTDPIAFSGNNNCVVSDLDDREGGLDTVLKLGYRGFPIGFWKRLQRLHDNKRHWIKKGLSAAGKIAAEKIRLRYCS